MNLKRQKTQISKILKLEFPLQWKKMELLPYIESAPAIDNSIEQEIIRVISLSPKWQPENLMDKK
jgi:hypothetical protein